MRGTIIIAQYEEDLSWVEEFKKEWVIDVITKGVHMPNVGREPASYLQYIITNYERLVGDLVFVQGNPFDHCPIENFREQLELPILFYRGFSKKVAVDDNMGCPNDCGLPLVEVYEELFGTTCPAQFTFAVGCQFTINSDVVRLKPKEWYEKALSVCLRHEKAPWCFERFMRMVMN